MSHQAFKYKLMPSQPQSNKLAQFGGATRFVYNYFLALAIDTHHKQQRPISFSEMCRLLTQLKQTEENSWLSDVHSQVLQQSLKDLESAYKNFFRNLKAGKLPKTADGSFKKRKNGQLKGSPNFKKKSKFSDSFRYPQGIKIEDNRIYLPKIGWIGFYKSRDLIGRIKSVTVTQHPSGWYVSILCETPDVQQGIVAPPRLIIV